MLDIFLHGMDVPGKGAGMGNYSNFTHIIFYCLFTPIALVLRVFRPGVFGRSFNKNALTYWHQREKNTFSKLDYERLY